MILLLIIVISIFGIIIGKLLFKKWTNHLTIYCFIWGGLVLLYEMKLLPYVDLIPLAWFFIISAFLSFLCGILTIISARNLFDKEEILINKSDVSFEIFIDNGKALKYSIFFFSLITLYAAIQNWLVLLNKYGSIPAVFLNASTIYKLNSKGDIKGILPYFSYFGYVAIFFSGIYTAYKGKFSLLSFFPFLGIVLKELAVVGRAGMLFALMEFIFSFVFFRHLLKDDKKNRYKFSKKNAIIATSILLAFFIVSASFVRITRGSFESYTGASRELRQLQDNMILSPSLYLYLSSDVGVLSQYLDSEGEKTMPGQHTLLPIYYLLAKFDLVERPKDFQKGYFIPMWTNTGTYIRELHADFGIAGVFLVPFLLGLIITWLWFKFYEKKNLIVLAFLVFLNLIVGFSFLVMITRLLYWFIALFVILVYLQILKKIAKMNYLKLLDDTFGKT